MTRISSPRRPPLSVSTLSLRPTPPSFCVDEKTAIQALDHLDPVLPLSPGRAERHGFEYFRHGTLSLYAALEVASGQVLGKTALRHTSAEFVAFLADVVATQPLEKEIQVIADNLSAHKTRAVTEFLALHPNLQIHYTPNLLFLAQSGRTLVLQKFSAICSPAASSLPKLTSLAKS